MACRKSGQARDTAEERGDQGEDGGGAAGPVDVKGTLAAPFLRPLVEIWEALPRLDGRHLDAFKAPGYYQ
jgi:hypothetical protein